MKRNWFTLLISGLLMVAMLLSLTACSGTGSETSTTQESSAAEEEDEGYPLMTILETTGHHYQLQSDSYEATDTTGGFRHYICDDCGDEYSYETDPLVYTTNPKTGEPVDQADAYNPTLPSYEHVPDGEPQVFWSKADNEWRVYLYGSHDKSGTAMCDKDQVVWSAPVYDLSDWRYEGVVLDITDGDPYDGQTLYAPDTAYDLQTDCYFMVANEVFSSIVVRVADNPAGPWDKDQAYWVTSFKKAYDPTIYIENGTIYVAGACRRTEEAVSDAKVYAALEADGFTTGSGQILAIYQVKADPQDGDGVEAVSYMPTDEKIYLPIYEGPSLYGWCEEAGAYIMLYVTQEIGADGTEYNSTIGYVWTDDLINGTWHYGDNGVDDILEGVEQLPQGGHGNIISDTSGRYSVDATTGEMTFTDFPTYLVGNNHGGMVKINGMWYFNGHRQSGAHMFSRQAVMGEITVSQNESGEPLITPMEFTSAGAAGTMDASEVLEAQTVCYLIADESTPAAAVEKGNPEYAQIENATTPYVQPTRDETATHASYITNITDGNVAGYKYLEFGETGASGAIKLLVSKPDGAVDGTVDVYLDAPTEAQGGTKVATVSLSASDVEAGESEEASDGTVWHWVTGTLDEAVTGEHAVYFVFHASSEGQIVNFDQFSFGE